MEEQRGAVVEPGEAMEAETRLEEVRTDRTEAGHPAGTKSTTTASRTLPRRHRQERSSRHQELCQETTTATTGLATTTTVMIPVGSVQVKNSRPVLPYVPDFQPGCLVLAWQAAPSDVPQRNDPCNLSLNSWLKLPVFTSTTP